MEIEEVTSKLPNIVQNNPIVVYNGFYNICSSTHNKSLNYKSVANIIDGNDLETFGTVLRDCSCKKSSFVNRDHGHIITGDLVPLKINI